MRKNRVCHEKDECQTVSQRNAPKQEERCVRIKAHENANTAPPFSNSTTHENAHSATSFFDANAPANTPAITPQAQIQTRANHDHRITIERKCHG